MDGPCIEVTFAKVGKATVEDESTEDGKRYLKAFHDGVTGIPGCARGSWGRSDKYDEWVTHFLEHDVHKALIGGPTPPVLDGLQSETSVYVIRPNTNDRTKVYYSPDVHIVVFWGIKEEQWTKLAPDWFASIAHSDSCNGYIWGEVVHPILSDVSGNGKLGSGRHGVMISGWRSREQHDRDVANPRVTKSYDALQAACESKDTWGMSLKVFENTGHVHMWRTPLGTKDRSAWLPAAGIV